MTHILVSIAALAAVGQTANDMKSLNWLTGTYEGKYQGVDVEMTWSPATGTTMTGMRRMSERGITEDVDFFTIRREGTKLTLHIMRGDPAKSLNVFPYPIKGSGGQSLTFENRNVQFPRTVTIARQPNGDLRIVFDGVGAPTPENMVEDPKNPRVGRQRTETYTLKPKRS